MTSEARAVTSDFSGPALRAFFAITSAWSLTAAQERRLLGDPPAAIFLEMKRAKEGRVPREQLERISYVLGIYKALQILFSDPVRADAWIKAPNSAPCIGDRSALERMLSGDVADLIVVREYLDAQRHGEE